MRAQVRSLISVADLEGGELDALVRRGAWFATGRTARPLAGKVVGAYFAKTSTRTRTAFSSAALRLGAGLITYGPNDLQTNTGETQQDTGRVFASMLDILVARTAGDQADMRAWAANGPMAVINAMSAQEHPTQALADLTTMFQHFGRINDLRILYVGEGNNTATALTLALTRLEGVELELRTPPGYGVAQHILALARTQAAANGAKLSERHVMAGLPQGVDVVYTTRWQTTGTSKPDPNWHEIFAPFQVREELWLSSPKAVFMHDLPAHRGQEVTAEVLDGPHSIAFQQAANKMYSAMAVLEWSHTMPLERETQP